VEAQKDTINVISLINNSDLGMKISTITTHTALKRNRNNECKQTTGISNTVRACFSKKELFSLNMNPNRNSDVLLAIKN
jgi:hypothetical protein